MDQGKTDQVQGTQNAPAQQGTMSAGNPVQPQPVSGSQVPQTAQPQQPPVQAPQEQAASSPIPPTVQQQPVSAPQPSAPSPAPQQQTTPAAPTPSQAQQAPVEQESMDQQESQPGPTPSEKYIYYVGGGLIELLTQISTNDGQLQKVADTMRMPATDAASLLKELLEKIDSGALTDAELAFLMTAPVADETPMKGKPA